MKPQNVCTSRKSSQQKTKRPPKVMQDIRRKQKTILCKRSDENEKWTRNLEENPQKINTKRLLKSRMKSHNQRWYLLFIVALCPAKEGKERCVYSDQIQEPIVNNSLSRINFRNIKTNKMTMKIAKLIAIPTSLIVRPFTSFDRWMSTNNFCARKTHSDPQNEDHHLWGQNHWRLQEDWVAKLWSS
jgi:hypothetical protein